MTDQHRAGKTCEHGSRKPEARPRKGSPQGGWIVMHPHPRASCTTLAPGHSPIEMGAGENPATCGPGLLAGKGQGLGWADPWGLLPAGNYHFLPFPQQQLPQLWHIPLACHNPGPAHAHSAQRAQSPAELCQPVDPFTPSWCLSSWSWQSWSLPLHMGTRGAGPCPPPSTAQLSWEPQSSRGPMMLSRCHLPRALSHALGIHHAVEKASLPHMS